jgi:ATP-dependent Clp protease ATP-binding subunit ClpC
MNGYYFTERVRNILELARRVAGEWRHDYVGTEHMLLGLIKEGNGVGAAVLQNLDVELNGLKARVEHHVKPGNGGHPTGPDLPYTSRAKKVLELAMSEARDLSHSYVGSEHLLIALLQEKKGIAAQALRDAGMTIDVLRTETLRWLGTEVPAPRPTGAETGAFHAPAPSAAIANIAIDIRLADGSNIRGEFENVSAALNFLMHTGHSSARRDS